MDRLRRDGGCNPRRAIADASCTRVVAARAVKVLAYNDNEFGYAHRLVELAALAGR